MGIRHEGLPLCGDKGGDGRCDRAAEAGRDVVEAGVADPGHGWEKPTVERTAPRGDIKRVRRLSRVGLERRKMIKKVGIYR
jgi:hypothetical protein